MALVSHLNFRVHSAKLAAAKYAFANKVFRGDDESLMLTIGNDCATHMSALKLQYDCNLGASATDCLPPVSGWGPLANDDIPF